MVKLAKPLTLSLCATLLLACGEQAEVVDLGPVVMPAEHEAVANPPPAEAQGPRQVILPEALQGKYQRVTMMLQLPGQEQTTSLELPLSGEPQQTDYGTLLARDYLPAFLISGNTITSDGVDEKNPAVWVEWQHEGKKIFAGWLFRDYPTLNPMLVADYQLTFKGPK